MPTRFYDLDIDFENMEAWWGEAFAEYLEQTTPRSVTEGLIDERYRRVKTKTKTKFWWNKLIIQWRFILSFNKWRRFNWNS